MAAGLAIFVSLGGCGTGGQPAGPPRRVPAAQLRQSVARAYAFLDQMTDRYATGSTPRLVQSFTGGTLGRQHFTASQTYDDALVIDAFLASGTAAGRSKAVAIGDGLLRAQASDPRHDGRLRAAYASALPGNASDAAATNLATLAGNMAWAGLALLQPQAVRPISPERRPSVTGFKRTATTSADPVGTPAAKRPRARPFPGNRPSTTLISMRSSGCSPRRRETRRGRPGRRGPGIS